MPRPPGRRLPPLFVDPRRRIDRRRLIADLDGRAQLDREWIRRCWYQKHRIEKLKQQRLSL